MRLVSALVVSLSVALFASPAYAEPAAENVNDTDYVPEYTRRSDFHFGASLGLMAANARGYPNEAGKIDNDRYVADTGIGMGSMTSVWLGGALRDWFNFGVGIVGVGFKNGDVEAGGGGFIFRVEAFPGFSLGGPWVDLGLYGSFGIGGMTIDQDGEEAADGGAMSIVAFGAFWEPLRFGNFSAGPTLEYARLFSQSLEAQAASAGMRLSFYAGP